MVKPIQVHMKEEQIGMKKVNKYLIEKLFSFRLPLNLIEV